jgi:hypothetical protein
VKCDPTFVFPVLLYGLLFKAIALEESKGKFPAWFAVWCGCHGYACRWVAVRVTVRTDLLLVGELLELAKPIVREGSGVVRLYSVHPVQRGESPRAMTLLELLESLDNEQTSVGTVHANVLAGYPMSHVIADRLADVIKFTVAAQRRGAMSQAMKHRKVKRLIQSKD